MSVSTELLIKYQTNTCISDAIKTHVIHTTRKGKLTLLCAPFILSDSVRLLHFHTNSYNNAATQCNVEGSQRTMGYLSVNNLVISVSH